MFNIICFEGDDVVSVRSMKFVRCCGSLQEGYLKLSCVVRGEFQREWEEEEELGGYRVVEGKVIWNFFKFVGRIRGCWDGIGKGEKKDEVGYVSVLLGILIVF